MNAVEIADAVSTLVEQPLDRDKFPFAFLEAFGNKDDTERLEKLFELYTKMTGAPTSPSAQRMRKPMIEP